jgi:CheY-like chemotaxis protein
MKKSESEKAAKTILIVDDDQRNIFALSAVLQAENYKCITASSAQQGLQRLAEHPEIAVVLLDMMMPDMDGYEAITAIRNSAHKNIPIISVTAQAMAGDKERCISAGANGYVSKPIDVDYLFLLLKDLPA